MATQPSDTSKHRALSSPADELAVIAQRAQAFTNASGAAIAIGEGNADEIVCLARSGSSAPDVGAVLSVQGTFTGLCIQTGRELRCDDAETDTRVDMAAIRKLGIRSMVITPIKEDNRAVGVLAVFASTPHAFTITHVAVLKTMADQIASLLLRERRSKEEGSLPPPPPVMPKPPASVVPHVPVVVKPAAPIHPPSAPMIVPPRPPSAQPVRVEPIRPVALAADVVPAVPFPKREEKRPDLVTDQPVPKATFGTLDAVTAEESGAASRSKAPIAIGLVLLVAAGVGIWQYARFKKGQTTAAQAQPAVVSAAPAQPVDPNAAANPANATPAGGVPGAAASNPPATSSTVVAKPAPAEKPDARRNAETQKPPKPSPAEPATVSVSNTLPSKIVAGAAQSQPPAADAPPPTLAATSASSVPGALTNISRQSSTPVPGTVMQSNLVPVKLLRTVQPVYPQIAKARRLTDTVTLDVLVGKDGKVANVVFKSGMPVFRDAALDAVKRWVFSPATLNGQPTEQQTEVKLNFKPQ